MRKITSFMLMLLCAMTTWAQTSLHVSEGLPGTLTNGQYSWTSGKIEMPEGHNKLRVTFLENTNKSWLAGFPMVCIAEFYLYDKDGEPVELNVDRFFSNATQGNEGNMAAICDGFTTQQEDVDPYQWYWHSQWSGTPNPYGYHYLEVDLANIEADLSEYSIGWVTRQQNGSPAEVVISTGTSSDEATENANNAMMPKISSAENRYYYTIRSVRSKNYLTYSAEHAKPQQNGSIINESYWYFTEGTDGKVAMHNVISGKVLGTNFEMSTEGEWKLLPAKYRPGIVITKSDYTGGCIDDQSGSIGGWEHTSGDNEGTTWLIEKHNAASIEAKSFLQNKIIASIGSPVTEVKEGWYILNNAGRGNYVSQEGDSWKMRSAIAEGQIAEARAGYLFKITKNGDYYNIISGNGKYFQLGHNTASTSATAVNFEIGLIGESANNFYIFDKDHGYAADGQETNNAFVGWATAHPTSAGGNDSYRLLPVEFDEISVNDGYYYIKGTGTGNNAAWYMSYDGDKWTAVDAGEGVKQIWKIELKGEGYTMMSCNVGKFANLENASGNGGAASTLLDAENKFGFIKKESDKYIIKNAGNNVVRTENGGAINFWSGEAGETWQLVPVTEVEVSINEFASICLPFAVEVEGAVAYAIEEIGTESAQLAVKSDIPANEGAILAGNGVATLKIINEATADWSANKLEGTTVDTTIENDAYVLGKVDGKIGLYKALKTDGSWKNNANKAYLPMTEGMNAVAYSFRNADVDGDNDATAIEEVETENAEVVIYDLAGRRINEITEGGVYIVNGKKILVK